MSNNYFDVFPSYAPRRGYVDMMVAHGDFVVDEVYIMSQVIREKLTKINTEGKPNG